MFRRSLSGAAAFTFIYAHHHLSREAAVFQQMFPWVQVAKCVPFDSHLYIRNHSTTPAQEQAFPSFFLTESATFFSSSSLKLGISYALSGDAAVLGEPSIICKKASGRTVFVSTLLKRRCRIHIHICPSPPFPRGCRFPADVSMGSSGKMCTF